MAVSARPDGVTLGPTTGWGRLTIGLAAGFIVFGIAFFIAAATGQKGGDTLGDNLHLAVKGENAHHMVEACFKVTARTLRQAIRREGDELPSTKGAL